MRILIDAIPLLVRSAGVKNYLFHWIVHLRRLLGDEKIQLFPFLDRLPDLDHEGSIVDAPGTLARQGLLFALNLRPNYCVDLMGPPSGVFHATKLVHAPRRLELSATLHDMTCWLMPELHQPANVAAEKRFAECIWKKADGLIAVSESTRNDAVRVLGLDPEIIQVIYPGVASAYFSASYEDFAARSKYALDKAYVLYVGTVEPRKNLNRLLDVWQSCRGTLREQFDLVVIGPEGWQSAKTMARLRAAKDVRYLGYVPEADLPALTAGATVFVYPSLYEGFGFPVAQAMAAGVPVITSNLSSLPEVTGGAAELIDPLSPAELRDALDRLLTSPAARLKLAAAGRAQARRFQWDTCAAQSAGFFERILSRPRARLSASAGNIRGVR